MDAKSLISNKKRKKHCDRKGKGKDESGIRICDLPDPILQLIISSLSTKEAVRTSVLSKRWVYLWRDISRIELKEVSPEKRQQFIDFVRRLLVVCDSSNLEKLSISCGVDASEIQPPGYWYNKDWGRDVGYFVFKLLKEIPNVEKLTISELALGEISDSVSLLEHLPLFCNLVKLDVYASASPISLSCEALLTILRNSPCLQAVSFIMGGVSLPKDCANNMHILDPLPVKEVVQSDPKVS
ncbi:Leucine-rich repeat domain superfamily [Sesbania bispinosa]|nr:Leucine-rich repeat domain superfamily [Sesbania bispinosa]